MRREEIVELCDREVLGRVTRLFGTSRDALKVYDSYEGCQNLVYDYERQGRPMVLRISYRANRPVEQIQAELEFVNYLADRGAGVSRAVTSHAGNLIEAVEAGGIQFLAVSFVKGRGMRVPDNGYRYREGVPIEEYFQNWGQVLGKMHRLAKEYEGVRKGSKRPEWREMERFLDVDRRVPERLPLVRERFQDLMEEVQALPKDRESYGLIHADFNDGNFTVDYSNGDITVFDFDDACYFWYMYDLACAWEGGVGRAMFRGLAERKAFMDHYFEQVLEGYHRENRLEAGWLEWLPLYLKLIEMEEFLYYARYIDDPDEELQAALGYKIRCIEDGIPYLGFFDGVFSPEKPFKLV